MGPFSPSGKEGDCVASSHLFILRNHQNQRWSTFPRADALFAGSAKSTKLTRSPSTKSLRNVPLLRAEDVTMLNRLKMECNKCRIKSQVPLKRCKHFELGGDKKRKGQ